jgi:hypothetical protein
MCFLRPHPDLDFDPNLAIQHAVLEAAGCEVILVEQASVYRGR